jgi:hypothetical protein
MIAAGMLLAAGLSAPAAQRDKAATAKEPRKMHRYMVIRTFPPGALDNLDLAAKQKVNAGNEASGARWIQSYANADRTKTFCVYEGVDEAAIRKAAAVNGLPVDSIMEIPVDLLPH